MKLHIVSDLHFEYEPAWKLPETDADVLILAGDIMPGLRGMARFARYGKPVIYVPGNHEYYGESVQGLSSAMSIFAGSLGVHLLDNKELVLGDVRFLGTTLWTDYNLFGIERSGEATRIANQHLNDYIAIHANGGLLTPGQTISMHQRATTWLESKLAEPFSGKTVVVSHHAPHPNSVHPRLNGHILNAAYASDLSRLMGTAVLWVHGHTHQSFDYVVDGTRVVANPKGYRNENKQFDPAYTVAI